MTLTFNDVSHYQGDYHPSGPTIAKATEGTSFVDSQYATNRQRTLAGGWPFCGYHFLSTQDPAAQAQHAYSVIGSTPAMLDVESGTTGSPSLAQVVAFIDAYRKLGGILHLAYIPHWYWSGHWGSPSLKPLGDLGIALISSQYTTYSDTGPGWDPYGGITPSIWQYTSTPIDTNAFKGTQAQLGRLFATGTTEDTMTKDEFLTLLRDPDVKDALARAAVFGFDPGTIAADGTRHPNGGIPVPAYRPDYPSNVTAGLGWAVGELLGELHAARGDIAALPAAVAAALPPAATGGLTEADVQAVVHTELAKLGVSVSLAE